MAQCTGWAPDFHLTNHGYICAGTHCHDSIRFIALIYRKSSALQNGMSEPSYYEREHDVKRPKEIQSVQFICLFVCKIGRGTLTDSSSHSSARLLYIGCGSLSALIPSAPHHHRRLNQRVSSIHNCLCV